MAVRSLDDGHENHAHRGFRSQPAPQPQPAAAAAAADRPLVRLASAQHAVFALSQARELGYSARALQSRTEVFRLHRIHRTVYSLVPKALLTREGHWMAAVLACGPGAVLSHRTAAALHGLRPTRRPKIDVTVPRRSARMRQSIDVHRSSSLTPADVTAVHGIPCTTVARTLLDLAEVVADRPLERAFDQAEILEVFDLTALNDQLNRSLTRPGARRVRRVLAAHYIGSTPTESELEEAMYALCRRTEIPRPEVNKWVNLHDGETPIRADFLWRSERLILETDGRRFHDTHQRRERDPRRDQRTLLAGWRIVRTTWRQVMKRPQELEATLRGLLNAPPLTPAPARPRRRSARAAAGPRTGPSSSAR